MTRPSSTPALLLVALDDADQERLQGGWGWGGCKPPTPPICKPDHCATPVPPKPPIDPCSSGNSQGAHNGHGGSHLLGLLHLAAMLHAC